MARRYKWEKWLLSFWGMMAQHISVAGATWLGIGVKNGRIAWEDLWVAMVMGAILPTVFKFIGTNPWPEEETVSVTQTTTVTKVTPPDTVSPMPMPAIKDVTLPPPQDTPKV